MKRSWHLPAEIKKQLKSSNERSGLMDDALSSGVLVSGAQLSTFDVTRWRDGAQQSIQDQIAEETPIALIYNGISHAVMLATAQDLEDFALGFSLSEGILHNKSELYSIEVRAQAKGIELHCEIASERFVQLKDHRRTLVGRTGCGLCGSESLEQAIRYPLKLEAQVVFDHSAIQRGLQAMPLQQKLQQQTGATHACAWVLADGTVDMVREDVGRHNA
ncbi:MAG: formate dehydrogenase accessory sulfurtransferase FdhD, partial [Methylotenera sp.]